ncbi:MAG: non-ribosomal peptide synthetase, partial [Chloroflexi bacterium]|nr:non-ribosomal peptide synthetase [Chloroflexota bacterium]
DYMVPSAYVALSRLPLTPNGKLDRAALPAPELRGGRERRLPRTPQEEILCALFAQVLGVAEVGVDDNFFTLGGDSIMSIQLVSRARQAGLLITPRAVFQHQTVAQLAAAVTPVEAVPAAAPDVADGTVPATPIMCWLAEQGWPSDRFQQALLLRVPAGVREDDLAAALQAVLDHHDALRLHGTAGMFVVAARGSVSARACLRRIDVAGVDEAALAACVSRSAAEAEGRLSPGAGVMVQAVWLDAGAADGRLLLMIHHLSVDGVSWRILVPDLAAAWSAIAQGHEPRLSARGTSFRRWAQVLAEEAQSAQRVGELGYWREVLSAPSVRLLDEIPAANAAVEHLRVTLPEATTAALLTRVPAAFHGGINDVLLTGLVVALLDWSRRHGRGGSQGGNQGVLLDLEGHGREEVLGGVDLTHTVGWFTSQFPVHLSLGDVALEDALAGGAGLGRALKHVKEQLRSLPDNGLGYGLLRYLNATTRRELAGFASPQIGFNYLGRFGGSGTLWGAAPEAVRLGGGEQPLGHALEVNAVTVDTAQADGAQGAQLSATWSWRSGALAATAVAELAQGWRAALEALVRHVDAGGGGRSPSDVPLVRLTQGEIERLERSLGGIEDILPLSPLQEGLLFHALYDARAPDVYTVQQELELVGPLDEERLAAAVRALVARHGSLRACFRQEGLSAPVQVVVGKVDLPWRSVDLSSVPEAERSAPLRALLAQERAERFDLSRAPLLRFALVRLAAERSVLVLTSHHILLDGWSMPVLVEDLLRLYRSRGDGSSLPRVTPYRDYLVWLSRQDRAASLAAWGEALRGLEGGTRLGRAGSDHPASAPEEISVELNASLTASLTREARRAGVTLASVLQAAWAVLLGRLSGRDDVVLGVTVSGRPAELAGIERMVGLLINTLPLRVQVSAELPIRALWHQVQESQSLLMTHQHVGLAEIQGAAGLGELFDTLFVLENYPVSRAELSVAGGALRLSGIAGSDATHYALSVAVVPGDRLQVRLGYRPDLLEGSAVHEIADRLVRVLEATVASPDRRIGGLEILSAEERRRILEDWNATQRVVPSGTLVSLFGRQVERTPAAVAVLAGEERL